MKHYTGGLDGTGLRIAVVSGRFNEAVVDRLVSGALDCLRRHGVAEEDLLVATVPGSWELPVVARRLAERRDVDGIVALGAVVRGQTAHFDYVAGEAAKVGRVALDTGVPVGFGVLTTETFDQAVDRAGGKLGNKGWETALAVLETVNLLRAIDKTEPLQDAEDG